MRAVKAAEPKAGAFPVSEDISGVALKLLRVMHGEINSLHGMEKRIMENLGSACMLNAADHVRILAFVKHAQQDMDTVNYRREALLHLLGQIEAATEHVR